MTIEEKTLLVKDLSARLPYEVKCHFKYGTSEDDIILKCIDGNIARFDYGWYGKFHVIIDPQYIKPYFRPLSSMTKEEKRELSKKYVWNINCGQIEIQYHSEGCWDDNIECPTSEYLNLFDWLNARHFDYRGLIEMGLALEAPEGMYKN